MSKSRIFTEVVYKFITAISIVVFSATQTIAQNPVPGNQPQDLTLLYLLMFVMIILLCIAIYFRYKSSQSQAFEGGSTKKQDFDSVNADKELAWLRRNGNKLDKSQDFKNYSKNGGKNVRPKKALKISVDFDESYFAPLPVFTFTELKTPEPFDSLPISNDPELMNAIEQVKDELEDDERSREIFLEVLAEFQNRNSIEAISEVALYDLSAPLRSKALNVLSEFDHESVFETILLACADPTREVRAAAARALFRVNFNRADAWARLAQCGEKWKMVQMARAAIEGDLVKRSFERLVHKDAKYAYEAYALLCLLIKAGETDIIFDSLKNHPDMNVQTAILHTIKTTQDKDALAGLNSLLEDKNVNPDVHKKIDKTIEEIGLVTA
jgi:hypothetical protein